MSRPIPRRLAAPFILLLCFAIFDRATAGVAEGRVPLAIEAAVEESFENNPGLLAARQEIEVARGRLERARYWNPFNPEVEGGIARRRFDGGGSDSQRSAGVALEVEIAGQRAKRIAEAEKNLARVESEVADVERRLLADVKDAFYGALVQRRRLELFRRVEDLNRRLREASTERFRAGETPKIDANLAVIRHDRSRKDVLAAEREHRSALLELEGLLGREPRGDTEVAGDLVLPAIEIDAERLVEAALRSRPDLRAREAEIARIDAEIELTRRLIVPNPTLRGTYEEETEGAGSRDRIFGGGLSIPIPLFDRKQAELTGLRGEKRRAIHERNAGALQVRKEILDALQGYEAARRAVEIFAAGSGERIEESFRFLETAYREGKIGLLELVAGTNELIDSEISYLGSVADYWVAHVALERAAGTTMAGAVAP